MQVFRLMGMPDKVLAFDSLPDRLLVGLDMTKADGFPRHWKEWMGKTKRVTRIPPERNPMTGEVRTYKPIEEEDYYFYLVDWHIRVQEERWDEIKEFVRKYAPQDERLPDKLEDLAKPLAKDKLEAVSLEPEEVNIIKIPLQHQERVVAASDGDAVKPQVIKTEPDAKIVCPEEGCGKEFGSKQAIRLHTLKKHSKKPVAV